MLLAHATVSSMKPNITPDLVIGTCVLIAIAFPYGLIIEH
jgi:hypothetical protein